MSKKSKISKINYGVVLILVFYKKVIASIRFAKMLANKK